MTILSQFLKVWASHFLRAKTTSVNQIKTKKYNSNLRLDSLTAGILTAFINIAAEVAKS